MTKTDLFIARQMQLLLEHTSAPNTRPYTITAVADMIGITPQTLLNMLHARIENPRLNTLRSLCRFYDISLDYFDLRTEDACLRYLHAHQLKHSPALVQQIQAEADRLTERGYRNILATLHWRLMSLRFKTERP